MRNSLARRAIATAAVALGALAVAPSAGAVVTTAFDGQVTCTPMAAPNAGKLNCSSPSTGVKTWDNQTVVDVNLFVPSANPPAGGYPLIGFYHGWGGSKVGITSQTQGYLDAGYAVFSMSDRGWGNSCGGTDPKRVTGGGPGGACEEGYNHLMDTRYEVRDAQYLISLLADDGIVDGQRTGATGPSYGGGLSMALAALKDRTMLPNDNLVAWTSPDGKPMRTAAAAPEIPWTDLAYSLQPNGATLDYVANAPYKGPNGDKRIGVLKQSFVAGLYGTGQAASNYTAPGTDPDADLTTWFTSINAGEPYDSNPLSNEIVDEITTHHSSYYIDHSTPPAPLLISNGWTDDLFPADEAIRFYNRTRTEYPSADISLFFRDYGHQRGGTHPGDAAQLATQQRAWFDHFVKGTGGAPFEGVTALTQTCPNSASGAAPSAGPFQAPTWAAMAPGEIRHESAAVQPISPQGGNPQTNQAFDPIAGGGACATAMGTDAPGAANYRLPAAPAGGFTLMGSPTIVADIYSPGVNSQIAARLLDVGPDGNETLIARGLWRPRVNIGTESTRQVFQLHPNGWRFAEGHVPKLELLPNDQPYGRNSNGQAPITVENLELRLPVLEQPGALGGLVQAPAGKILPQGYALAAGFAPNNDTDNDGWPNDTDNCPNNANGTQLDSDGDGTGDACDAVDDDTDNDGVVDTNDNCPGVSNPAQTDTDEDGEGDVCDADDDNDIDGDGVANGNDNCPEVGNPGQQDSDEDGIGNACDSTDNTDLDDDGVADDEDNCADQPNPGQQDTDGDGLGNACDALNDNDFDDDGVANAGDNCPTSGNNGQSDGDGDGLGDACDPTDDDPDRDGVPTASDGCPNQAGANANGCPTLTGSAAPQVGCSAQVTRTGTSGADTMDGTANGDRISGLSGDDVLRGLEGDDCLFGQRGRDSLDGGAGIDQIHGGPGRDHIVGGSASDRITGGRGNDVINAADGEADAVRCGGGRDRVIADRSDTIQGCERRG